MAESGSEHLPSGCIQAPVESCGVAKAHGAPALGREREVPSATAGLPA